MKENYQKYIASKAGVWSEASQRSEGQRLNKVLHLIDGDAAKLWPALDHYNPNARATLWTRVSAFWDWAIENGHAQGPNPYKEFKKRNPRPFRGCYQRKPCQQAYDEIMGKLDTIRDPEIRNTCKVLLVGGLRWHELYKIDGDHVTGKGGKRRKVYLPDPLGPIVTRHRYSAVLRQLKAFGLTPHKLRHARMTDMVNKGATIFQLKKFAGWSNISVAESYVYARDEEIQRLAESRKDAQVNGVMGVLKFIAKTAKRAVEVT